MTDAVAFLLLVRLIAACGSSTIKACLCAMCCAERCVLCSIIYYTANLRIVQLLHRYSIVCYRVSMLQKQLCLPLSLRAGLLPLLEAAFLFFVVAIAAVLLLAAVLLAASNAVAVKSLLL
jgi:hypothetical protein